MKAIVAGFIVIALSGAAVLWHRCSQQTVLIAPAVESTAHCMVWKAQRGGATVWLCGSMHLLRESDYPLPQPYLTAFEEAKTVVMERPPARISDPETSNQFNAAGMLPDGGSLQDFVSAKAWSALESWSRRSGVSLNVLRPMKPWLAALTISMATYERLGFSSRHGMERWFGERLGDKLSAGLEVPEAQMAMFNRIPEPTVERMMLQAITEEQQSEVRVQKVATAWRIGDAPGVAAMVDEQMRDFPDVKKLLFTDRNAAWLPAIEKYLDGTETVMVLVGSGHLAGPGSLIDLLEKKGVTLKQMEFRTTRAAQ